MECQFGLIVHKHLHGLHRKTGPTLVDKPWCTDMKIVIKAQNRREKKNTQGNHSRFSEVHVCLISYMKCELRKAALYLFSWTKAEPGGVPVLTKPVLPITLPLWYGHLWHGEPQVGKATRDCATNPDPHGLNEEINRGIVRNPLMEAKGKIYNLAIN